MRASAHREPDQQSHTTTIAAGARNFFSFQPSYGGASGLCRVSRVTASRADGLFVEDVRTGNRSLFLRGGERVPLHHVCLFAAEMRAELPVGMYFVLDVINEGGEALETRVEVEFSPVVEVKDPQALRDLVSHVTLTSVRLTKVHGTSGISGRVSRISGLQLPCRVVGLRTDLDDVPLGQVRVELPIPEHVDAAQAMGFNLTDLGLGDVRAARDLRVLAKSPGPSPYSLLVDPATRLPSPLSVPVDHPIAVFLDDPRARVATLVVACEW